MRRILIGLIAALAGLVISIVTIGARPLFQQPPKESKEQPAKVKLDTDSLADWAAEKATAIRLLVRPGDYVFPNAPIAVIKPHAAGVRPRRFR